MSSSSSPPPPSQRKIAPLPLRARKSSGQPRDAPTVLDPQLGSPPKLSSGITSGISQTPSSDSRTSNRGDEYNSVSTGDAHHLSPPAVVSPAPIFHFGQNINNSQSTEGHETHTFRLLHNVTPRSSPQPEEIPLPSPPIRLGYSALPIPSTMEDENPQPLNTLYSKKRITVDGTDNLPGPVISTVIAPYSPVTTGTGITSSSRSVPSLSVTQTLDLVPSLSPSLHSRRISDVSIGSEADDNTSPYDVRDEEAPLEPFFTREFQTALQEGLSIAKNAGTAVEKLKGSVKSENDLERLLKDANDLSTFQSSDTRTIAVLGDSGEGKSSLINSLLDFPEIAKTGDIGAACTSVVTEYRQRTKDHTSPITIEVEYLSTLEIGELIKELLWNYRQLYLPGVESDEIDAKDYARYQRESEQAWSALEAAFKHQKLFKRDLLSDMSEGALEKVTDQLLLWTQDLAWPEGGNTGIWKSTADTAEECCQKTSIFMQDRLWPFTKIIRVYLGAQVLKTGVVLADLPGLQDTNLARVRATQKYLKKCDHVFIVAKISRAITDQSLKSSLYSVLSRHVPLEWEESAGKSLRLAVVCTKSEDINQKTARREFCGPNKRIEQSVMEQLDKDIEIAKEAGNRLLKKELKRRQEFLLVDARNKHVREGLQTAYRSKLPGGNLEVFCVSNTTYDKYSRKGNASMVRASGIPELRRFCHTITAGVQLLQAKHFLKSTLSSLLNSISIWTTNCPVQPQVDDSIYEDLQGVKAEVSITINKFRLEFNDTFRGLLLELMEEKRNDFWEGAAGVKGSAWTNWHWTQYNAWCLNDGDHSTAKRDHVNWNAEVIWKMRMELEYQWELLEDEIPIVFEQILKSIKDSLQALRSSVQEKGFPMSLAEGVDFRIRDIEYKFSLAQRDFAREVKLIRGYSSEPNSASYVVNEMIPAYRSAANQYGAGKAARQRNIVQGRITNGTLFPNISSAISDNMHELVEKTFSGLQDKVTAILSLIKADIDMAMASQRGNTGGDASQIDEEEEILREELADKIEKLKERHEELLDNIASY